MPNFRMTLSYDGTRYNGWQRQGNTPDTIQGRLEAVLSDLLAQPVEVAGSGRTDAGVHARMQTASFRAKTNLSAPELLRRLRAQLPGDIGVLTLTRRMSTASGTATRRTCSSAAMSMPCRSRSTRRPCSARRRCCAAGMTTRRSAPTAI